MRHRVKRDKLNRDYDNIRALKFSLAKALIENKEITTTLSKAKLIKPYVERLVTLGKKGDNLQTKRVLLKRLRNNKVLVEKLVNQISLANKDRPGGYLRIQKFFKRSGDNAKMAKISWLNYTVPKPKPEKKKNAEKVLNKNKK